MTQVSSFYLHVPFCRHLCNYCDFYKRKFEQPNQQFEDFHQTLNLEFVRHQKLMSSSGVQWGQLETIYFGGGTPSLWGTQGAEYFQKSEFGKLKRNTNAEFTMEIDPGTWTKELIDAWKNLGLNRISIGTQSLDPKFLKILDREHSLEDSYSLLEFCNQNEWNYSLDFLLGVPFSEHRNLQAELEQFLRYRPKHVSLYILNARSKYPYASQMPDDELIRREYLFVSEFLRSHGFHHYEVSNFALPGYESKHNLKYWRSESVAAFGPTGTGFFKEAKLRYKWKVSAAEVEIEELTESEIELERTYLELRTSFGWQPKQVNDQLLRLFEVWTEKNYGVWSGEKMQLNSLGFLMLDSLMDDLFVITAV